MIAAALLIIGRMTLNDLCANGDVTELEGTMAPPATRPLSRIRPPRMLGVFAQKRQI